MFTGDFSSLAILGHRWLDFQHLAVYPMDLVRTQYQTIRSGCKPRSSNPFLTMSHLFRAEGFRGLFRGSGAVVFGCGPAHALQFTIFGRWLKLTVIWKLVVQLDQVFYLVLTPLFWTLFHPLWKNWRKKKCKIKICPTWTAIWMLLLLVVVLVQLRTIFGWIPATS